MIYNNDSQAETINQKKVNKIVKNPLKITKCIQNCYKIGKTKSTETIGVTYRLCNPK